MENGVIVKWCHWEEVKWSEFIANLLWVAQRNETHLHRYNHKHSYSNSNKKRTTNKSKKGSFKIAFDDNKRKKWWFKRRMRKSWDKTEHIFKTNLDAYNAIITIMIIITI